MSAALYTARAGVETTVLTKGPGALDRAAHIQNYYGFAEPISGAELERRGIEGARALGVPVQQWSMLQRGEPVTLEDGAVIAPGQVLGAPRRGLRFVFSGDTAPCAALEQAAQDADLLLCDATYPDNEQEAQAKQWGHSTFAQGAAIAKKADVRRFWLMHYSPMILEPEAALPNAQAVFPAAECGFDGKQIILQYDEEAT